jgi:hypothetical protein
MPAIVRYRIRMPAMNRTRKTVPEMITVVPRSGCSITRPHTIAATGSSGIARWPRSSSLPHFLATTAAVNSTSVNLASSDGWTVTGPSRNQRDDPYASMPEAGCSTTTSMPSVRISSGSASRFQTSYRIRDVTTRPSTPITAYTAWRCTNTKLSPYSANADTELADSTMTSPVATRNAVAPSSSVTTRRERASARAREIGRSAGRTRRRWRGRGEAAPTELTSSRPPFRSRGRRP